MPARLGVVADGDYGPIDLVVAKAFLCPLDWAWSLTLSVAIGLFAIGLQLSVSMPARLGVVADMKSERALRELIAFLCPLDWAWSLTRQHIGQRYHGTLRFYARSIGRGR